MVIRDLDDNWEYPDDYDDLEHLISFHHQIQPASRTTHDCVQATIVTRH